nr:hypothetical protein [Tanacetum cinerariifolium]
MTLASSADKLSKTFDELMSTPIDFSAYIMNGLKITNLTQETLLGPAFKLLKVTRVEVMKKHGYGYLRKIEVRRADNDLYTFKESDFLRLRINDIEDMLILIVQIRLTNLLSNDVSDFAIALRMFTRSIVIQNQRDLPKDIPLVSLEVHRITKMIADIEVSHHGPSDAMHNPS